MRTVLQAGLAGVFAVILAPAGAQSSPPRDEVVARSLLPRAVKKNVAALSGATRSTQQERLDRARELLRAGRISGDPRTLGYAEAMLAGLADDDEVLVLRATIEQSRHRFSQARALLDRVLVRSAHPQALLTRATIATVSGDYADAASDCAALRPLHSEAAALCSANVGAVSGEAQRAEQIVAILVRRTDGELQAWALALQGQLAEQRGDATAAAAAYRAALALGEDLTTRLALADLLLARGQVDQASVLLRDAPAADGVLLRRWLATRAGGGADPALEAQLTQRFGDAAARGELLHAREAARFALARGDAAAALRMARDNWRVQREPGDLIVLAHAAHAARDRAARSEVEAWLQRTGLTDVRVRRALDGLAATT
jgi:tetratricopeptide (TPR) repeat protein